MPKKFYQNLIVKIESVNEEKYTLSGIFSTSDEDRHGDVVEQGWDLKHFKENPVILNSHTYYDATETIGKAIKIGVSKDGKLEGDIQFAVKENPKAKIIFDLYAGGYLRAFSVGFIPKQFDDKGTILKSELLEISAVSVPANAYALAKAKGIQVEKLYEHISKDSKDKKSNEEGKSRKGDSGKDKRGKGNGENKHSKDKHDKGAGVDKKTEWDEGENEIRYKLRGLSEFEEETFEREYYKKSIPAVKMTIGKNVKENNKSIQMLFFSKEQGWTITDAKEWVDKNNEEIKSFRKDIVIPLDVTEEKTIVEKNTNRFIKIQKAIELVGEGLKVEKSSDRIKAEKNLMINKTIKKLIELKK